MMFTLVVLFVFIINLLLDIYIVKQLKKTKNQTLRKAYYIILLLGILIPITAILMFVTQFTDNGLLCFMWLMFCFITLFLPKLVYFIFSIIGKFFKGYLKKSINAFAIICSIATFSVLLYSALVTANTPQVNTITLRYDRLPTKFDRFSIVQISDFHLGSFFSDSDFVADVVVCINEQNPDLILFTGDLVTSLSSEAERFKSVLSQLKARYGVWSVLGNHDYGDYYRWESNDAKHENFENLKKLQIECGWKLLNNSHVILRVNNDSIALIGVENWGDFPFPKYGDLNKACEGLSDTIFKVLMTHNPIHWRHEVLQKTNIDLTLSGHTHAMQSVVDVFGQKWSPANYRYKEWGGLYEEGEQRLYVNAGIGYVGLPIRIGVNPEITLIELKKNH